MRIVKPSFEVIDEIDGMEILKKLERIGRVCYKSENKITDGSALKFVKSLIDRGHEAMIEHVSLSVRFTVDRGVSHEIVRHRICSYAQESTRYCNYGNNDKGITVIEPCFWGQDTLDDDRKYLNWFNAMQEAENAYLSLLELGAPPQEARSVLPNSLKTEIVVTTNLREWRTILKLRTAAAAHPQMREVMCPLLNALKACIPIVFDDINY